LGFREAASRRIDRHNGRRSTPEVIAMRLRGPAALSVILIAAVAACGGPASPAASPAESLLTPVVSPSAAANGILLVALGDSGTTGHGDPSGKGWVQYYADRIQAGLGKPVTVKNLAQDGTTSAALLTAVQTDQALRDAITTANVVAIGIGGNDLNLGDAALEAKTCSGTACYDQPAADYQKNLDAVAAEITKLHAGTPVLLRAIGMPNAMTGAEAQLPDFLRGISTEIGAYEAKLIDAAACAAMHAHGGGCAPLRTAFNGPDGTANAYAKGLMSLDDCCYPSEAGHRLIADLLYQTGVEPL
jgi:lysophospholipase L1-like esterase